MSKQPNIIQITTHDSGRHVGCYGHSTLNTPAIDALAADGIKFSNYFCTVPICSASRASQLTGLYPQSNGLMDLVQFGWRLEDDVQHISHILRDAGYQTRLYGTQHEVLRNELDRLAFDVVNESTHTADVVAGEVAGFLLKEATSEQSFYLQIGFLETHTPFTRDGTKPDLSKGVEIPPYLADTGFSRNAMAEYQGSVKRMDAAVGTILNALRESGLEDDTIFIFTTDHGIEMPRAKWFLYDPGISIALIMRYPNGGLSGGRECDLLVSNVDYLPTILELVSVETPDPVEGLSFAGELQKEIPDPVREAVFGMYHKTQTRYVRTDRFKLIRHFDTAVDFAELPVRFEEMMNQRVVNRVELFDLESDPNEFSNVADQPEYAEEQRRLDGILWDWMESVNDPLLSGPVRTPSYEAAIRDYLKSR